MRDQITEGPSTRFCRSPGRAHSVTTLKSHQPPLPGASTASLRVLFRKQCFQRVNKSGGGPDRGRTSAEQLFSYERK